MKKVIFALIIMMCATTALNAKNNHSLGCISAYDAGYEIANWKQQGMTRLEAINKIKDIVSDSQEPVTLDQFNFLISSVNVVYDSKEKNAHALAFKIKTNCENTEF